MSRARTLITENIATWTGAIQARSTSGRGSSNKYELYGIKKLRELILELAVRGKLVPQDPNNEPACVLLKRIAAEKAELIKLGKIKKSKALPPISDDEKPFELPIGWEWCRFGEFCIEVSTGPFGSMINKRDYITNGIPLVNPSHMINGRVIEDTSITISEEKTKELKTYRLRENDIVMARRGEMGRCAIITAREDGWLCGTGSFYISFSNEISRHFIVNMFKSCYVRMYLGGNSIGSTMTNLNHSILNKMPVMVPSVPEQHRIVQKVDELMLLCDQLEQETESSIEAHATLVDTLLATLTNSADADELQQNWGRIAGHFDTLFTTERSIDALKQTILQLAVMGKLVRQNPNDEPASVLLERIAAEKDRLVKEKKIKKQKPLPEITDDEKPFELPEGWEWQWIGDVCSVVGGIQKQPKRKPVSNHYPYLRVANVQRGFITTTELERFELESDELEKWALEKGDLLVVEGNGSADEIGRCAIWNGEVDNCVYQNHLIRVRQYNSNMEQFIARYLNSPSGIETMKRMAVTTSGLYNLSVGKIKSIVFPVPPIQEQHRIVAKVDELMALCDQLKDKLRQSQQTQVHLTDAIVDQALA